MNILPDEIGSMLWPFQQKSYIGQRQFTIDNSRVPCLKRTDKWKYLGISFTPEGRSKTNALKDFIPKLELVIKAPLKPQQRFYVLPSVLLPQMSKDTPIGYFHAPVAEGGIGIVSL